MTTEIFFTLACAALIAYLFGLAMTFAGYKFFLILLPVWGFFFGFFLGAQSMQALFGTGFLATVYELGVRLYRRRNLCGASLPVLFRRGGDHQPGRSAILPRWGCCCGSACRWASWCGSSVSWRRSPWQQ